MSLSEKGYLKIELEEADKDLRELRERLIECEIALAHWGADSEYFLRWPERLTVDTEEPR